MISDELEDEVAQLRKRLLLYERPSVSVEGELSSTNRIYAEPAVFKILS